MNIKRLMDWAPGVHPPPQRPCRSAGSVTRTNARTRKGPRKQP